MLKKLTGNKLKDNLLEQINGGKITPLMIVFGNKCDEVCYDRCGLKDTSEDNQQSGQFEYRG